MVRQLVNNYVSDELPQRFVAAFHPFIENWATKQPDGIGTHGLFLAGFLSQRGTVVHSGQFERVQLQFIKQYVRGEVLDLQGDFPGCGSERFWNRGERLRRHFFKLSEVGSDPFCAGMFHRTGIAGLTSKWKRAVKVVTALSLVIRAAFLDFLARERGLPVTIHAINLQPAGDPLILAERAVRFADLEEKRRGGFVARAVLLDADRLDENAGRATRAKQLLSDSGFISIWQSRNHEAFLLRHVVGHEFDDPPSNQTLHRLRKQWHGYQKGTAVVRYQSHS